MRKITRCILAILALCILRAWAQTPSGAVPLTPRISELSAIKARHYESRGYSVLGAQLGTLNLPPGKYIIIEETNIVGGCTVELQPGTHIFFEPDVGLTVQGALVARGTADRPAVLSLVKATEAYIMLDAGATKWNGIVVADKGRVDLVNTRISGADVGIEGPVCDSIYLAGTIFSGTKSLAARIGNAQPEVTADQPFTLDCRALLGGRAQAEKSRQRSWRTPARLVCAAVAVCGAGLLTYGIVRNGNAYDSYKKEHDDPARAQAYQDQAKQGKGIAIAGGACAGLGTAGFVLTFAF